MEPGLLPPPLFSSDVWPLHAVVGTRAVFVRSTAEKETRDPHKANGLQAAGKPVNIGLGQHLSALTVNYLFVSFRDLDHSSQEKFRQGECPRKSKACELKRMNREMALPRTQPPSHLTACYTLSPEPSPQTVKSSLKKSQ